MRILLIVISSLLLSACAGEPTKLNYYLLRSDISADSNREMSNTGIVLTNVDVATYIDQPGLVFQTSNGQINAANYHVWAEPLRHSLMSFLANEISAKSGKDVYVDQSKIAAPLIKMNITIDQLHGTADGNTILVAYWTVIATKDGKQSQSTYQFSKSIPLESDGYGALVAAEKKLLNSLADGIAKSL